LRLCSISPVSSHWNSAYDAEAEAADEDVEADEAGGGSAASRGAGAGSRLLSQPSPPSSSPAGAPGFDEETSPAGGAPASAAEDALLLSLPSLTFCWSATEGGGGAFFEGFRPAF
jgi:hypothetical protein